VFPKIESCKILVHGSLTKLLYIGSVFNMLSSFEFLLWRIEDNTKMPADIQY